MLLSTLDLETFAQGGIEALRSAFDVEHERLFTFNLDAPHEFVNLRATALGQETHLPMEEIERGSEDPSTAKTRDTVVWMDGSEQLAGVYDRSRLRAGNRVRGPAIVTEMDSTTLVLSGHVAEVDGYGNILINPASE